MDIFQALSLCFCALGIALIYLILYDLVVRYASAELSASGALREKDAIQIYARADSLEYYLRVALAASASDRITIIVNISKNDRNKDEMKEIVHMMRRRHKNIFYRMM